MNVAIYVRVSTDKQSEKQLSIPAQLEAIETYAAGRGWTILDRFVDAGESARTSERPELQRLLHRCQQQPAIDIVLVHKIDRLARNVHDHAVIKATLKQYGVRLVSVVENVDESVSGELVENIMASIAQFYSANLAEEVKKGMRQKVLKGGWPHRPPRGYVTMRAAQRAESVIEIHPTEGPLMKRAFELYATGWYSVKALARTLHRQGLTSRSAGPMPHSHLRRLLSNPFYAGVVTWHGERRQGSHPALIGHPLFEKVQAVLRARHDNPGPKGSVTPGFPLRGLAVCAGCRGRMTGERHDRWSYYRCSRQTYRRDLCDARLCNVDRAHAGLERVCRQLSMGHDLAQQIMNACTSLLAERAREAERSHQRAEHERARLLESERQASAAFTAGAMTPEAFRAVAQTLRANGPAQCESHGPLPAAEAQARVGRILRLASSLWDLYQSLDERRRPALLKEVFETVILDHQGVIGFTLNPCFEALFSSSKEAPSRRAESLLAADAA